jgi:hypothetical protein
VRGLLVGGLLHDVQRRALEAGQRVVLGVRGELAAQVLAHLHADLGQQRAHAVLHGDRGVVAEVASERLRQLAVLGAEDVVDAGVEALGDRPRALDERRVELARRALELRLDEVGVGAGLLAVEHAGADLERVDDDRRGVLARLLALAREAHGGGVVDDQPVDAQALAGDADRRSEGERGGFHGSEVGR